MKATLTLTLFAALFLQFSANRVYAQNIAYYMGGGGDPMSDRTTFDPATEAAGNFFGKPPGWTTWVTYDGGRSGSESMVRRSFSGYSAPFTQDSVETEIKQVRMMIKNKTLGNGDQFLIVIDSHGGQPFEGEGTHSVATSLGFTSLDRLKELRDLLESAHVKVGILDFSCYSGNTQKLAYGSKLADAKTCVISGSASDRVSFSYTPLMFFQNAKPGDTLEEAFLRAREKDISPGSPEISTPAGIAAQKELEPLMADTTVPDDPGFVHEAMMRGCGGTQETSSISRLMGELNQISSRCPGLAQSIQVYNADLEKAGKMLNDIHQLDTKKKSFPVGKWEPLTYSMSELSNLNVDQLRINWSEAMGQSKGSERAHYIAELSTLTAVARYQQDLRNDPEFIRLMQEQRAYNQFAPTLMTDAENVAKEERSFYTTFYKKFSRQSDSNPCRDITL